MNSKVCRLRKSRQRERRLSNSLDSLEDEEDSRLDSERNDWGARISQVWTKNQAGIDCLIHVWSPNSAKQQRELPQGVVVVFHGLGGHGLFPTVRYLAELLARHNFQVYCMDFTGHGQSFGAKGVISSSHALLQDAMHVTNFAKSHCPGVPFFFAGNSMGGAIALLVSLQDCMEIDGIVLLAPMISLQISSWQRWLLQQIATWTPKFGLSKNNKSAADDQFRDENRKKEVLEDPFYYEGRLQAVSAMTCVQVCKEINQRLTHIDTPLFCLMAVDDVIVDNKGIIDLMELASSRDKTLKKYNALHGLLCEEKPVRSQIEKDILCWLLERI
mmetsp:Transcript_11339/g.16655  ORF Transcript_11339/g.16655 Transcript_11339/m.16655 type:complete len:329 (+) Transcript_11339:81-1067(+)|eukprot:CAMPEP_0194222772 /NCGR_PEP_ID=MMETSP0156-20130528/33732_1 /TAXON_ID=33649 /ORGANISM="Thalassionema nitzschioides, Strain L26-B" /LENGTH=328 /DNA_ID=CAMNT_0038953699 /DNA_START=1 /DNA_END=987 /DNA_ORIENTATION=+